MVPDLRTVISLTSDLIMNTLISLIILSSVAGSRVEVARCRAQCLDTLREDCAQGGEACSSCWSACEDLDKCQCGGEDRGCQVACDWSDQEFGHSGQLVHISPEFFFTTPDMTKILFLVKPSKMKSRILKDHLSRFLIRLMKLVKNSRHRPIPNLIEIHSMVIRQVAVIL